MLAGVIRTGCLALALASAPALGQINKCQIAGRVIYQEAPCPAGSTARAALEPTLQPSAYESEAARSRAQSDIEAAEAIRKRDDKSRQDQAEQRTKAYQAETKERAKTAKQAIACQKLREAIAKAEQQIQPSKNTQKQLSSDREKYDEDCATF